MMVTGKSAVSLGAGSGAPDLTAGRGDRGDVTTDRGDLEAAEGPRAFVDHLEVPRKGRWRGRYELDLNLKFNSSADFEI